LFLSGGFMATAFISHSSADKYFADLLVEILDYHHIKFWYDSSDIEIGKKYKERISLGLKSADYLIVVISENTVNSKWVARELSEFCANKPDGNVIPLLLSPVNVDNIYVGLDDYHSIFFYKNMREGFKELLSFFGKEFLPDVEKRQNEDRRKDDRRKEDRRKAPTCQRLRMGMWKFYEDVTGRGKFESLDVSTTDIMNIVHVFTRPISELNLYEFIDRSTKETVTITEDILTKATYTVFERFRSLTHFVNVIVIEALAEELNILYEIKEKGRREDSDRRDNSDRREPTNA
jgi:hypothetical protein